MNFWPSSSQISPLEWKLSPMKVLFLLKRNEVYGNYCGHRDSGLYNSARFVTDMLEDAGVDVKLAVVQDNNDIDRIVTGFQPSIVIIEAFWVVPEKFDVLKQLHPNVCWIVRGHSDWPFLAGEGMATEWIAGYLAREISVAFNSPNIVRDLEKITGREILYLPNYYPIHKRKFEKPCDDVLRIGCFGAIRPMKNHLLQAVAAIRFADLQGCKMEFHINARCEEGGNNVLKNLRGLFAMSEHTLVVHPWMGHGRFLELVAQMDFCLNVSLSETFCITAADAVAVGTPLICSGAIPWASGSSIVPVNDATEIVRKMDSIGMFTGWRNLRNLLRYSKQSRKIWLDTLSKIC